MEVIYRKLSEMKKLDGNPRKITQEQLDALKQSIEKNKDYFEARPLILSNRTGELVVIAGNQRYEACKQLGIEECPTVLLEGLTEEREKEIIIRDNVSNGEWDEELLQDWDAEDLADWGVDVKCEAFDLINMDDLNLDKTDFKKNEFSVTFIFDKELEDSFKLYFKENGKSSITKLIIDAICQDAEVK